jgi:hypothetical protein
VKILGHKFTQIEVGVMATIVVCVLLLIVAGKSMSEEKEKFMRDCMRDHKEYECTLMWKEAQPDTQYIYIPS